MTPETGKHATKLPDTNKKSDVRKQWTRLEKIIWPVAPDGYIPNSVVRSLAPFPKFSRPCANRGLRIMAQIEEAIVRSAKQRRLLTYFLDQFGPLKEEQENNEEDEISLENVIDSVTLPEETNITASLPSLHNQSEETKIRDSLTRRAVPQDQYLLQNITSLQLNASVEELQTNSSSVDDLQMKAASVQVLKSEENGEKDQNLCEKSKAFPAVQSETVKRGQNTVFKLPDVSTRMQTEQDELHQEIKEQKESDTMNKNIHVPEIGAPKRTMRHPPLNKLKSFVPPLPLLGDRRPNSVLFYLYKRSKEESAHEGVKHAPKVA